MVSILIVRFLLFYIFTIGVLHANYREALQYYNNAQYVQAIAAAKKSKKSYTNPNLHLLWGYSAKVLGHYDEAMHAFERVLILDKGNKQAQKALFSIYRQTDRLDLIEQNLDPSYHRRSRGLPIKSTVSVVTGYDSNANVSPGSTVLNEYFDTNTSEAQLSSYFTRMRAKASYTSDLGGKGRWFTKAVIRAYVQSNFSAHFYDLTTGSLELGIGYNDKKYDLYLPLTYYRVNYLEKDLLEQYRFSPSVMVPINDDITLDLLLHYSQNRYLLSEDSAKDDHTVGIGTGVYYLFGKHFAYFGLKYDHRVAEHANAESYIGVDFYSANVATSYYFSSSYLGTLNYQFRYGRYDDRVGLSNIRRDDNFHQLDLMLTYMVSKKMELYIAESYSQNLSNYVPSEYKKNSIMFGINLQY